MGHQAGVPMAVALALRSGSYVEVPGPDMHRQRVRRGPFIGRTAAAPTTGGASVYREMAATAMASGTCLDRVIRASLTKPWRREQGPSRPSSELCLANRPGRRGVRPHRGARERRATPGAA